jgi:Skp family chaperone for outer membrane proteins
LLFATPVAAAETALPARTIIAVVNVQKIIHESAAGKGLDMQYDKAHQAFADGVAAQERDLDAQEQELNRQRTVLTQDAFNAQRQALENHSAEVQRTIQQESQANQLAFNDAFADLANTIRLIVAAVAKEQNVTVVLPQDQTLYLGDGAIDITDIVLSRVDNKLPSISVALPKDDDTIGSHYAQPAKHPAGDQKMGDQK